MIIKALKTAYEADDRGKPVRILFATHSWAGAEFVDNEIRKVDVRDIFKVRENGKLDRRISSMLSRKNAIIRKSDFVPWSLFSIAPMAKSKRWRRSRK